MNRSMTLGLPFLTLGMLATASAEGVSGAELIYFGRASVKIKTASGVVIYIDP